jgi:hypothetical protein
MMISLELALPVPLATVSATLVATAAWLSRRAWRSARTIDLPFAPFAALSVFCNSFAFEHYHSLLRLPLTITGVALWRARLSGLAWW